MANIPLEEQRIATRTPTVAPAPLAPQPQMPKPPLTAVTGGTAPVGSLSPNQVYTDSSGRTIVGPKPTVTSTATQPPLTPTARPTGGTLPPTTTPIPAFTLPSLDGSNYVAQATGNPQAPAAVPQSQFTPVGPTAEQNLNNLLASDSRYIQNAALRGVEQAQSRGLRNSSIAGGQAVRGAIEAGLDVNAQTMQQQAQRENLTFQNTQNNTNRQLDMLQQREGQAFTGEQNQLNRIQQVNNAMLNYEFQRSLQGDQALQQDWLASNAYTRDFNGQLAALPIQNAVALSQMITQYAIENPEVYTPDTISGMQNFFTGSLATILQQYFPGTYGTPPGGGGGG